MRREIGMVAEPVRWGIMSTAGIARTAFLPALEASGGVAQVVAGRDRQRTEAFAHECGVPRSELGYETLLEDDEVEAIYIPLPNSLHAEWTIAALRSGKPVLCEKPMCLSIEEAHAVLSAARETGTPLWEAFVFPFHRQMDRVRDLIADGAIGETREVQSTFHFTLGSRDDIRLSRELAGGALNDVGCYCVALARLVFASEPVDGMAVARWAPEGVDEEIAGVLGFSGGRRLLFSCAMDLPHNTFARIVGTEGEIHLTNPFHPQGDDIVEVQSADRAEVFTSEQREPSFTPALRHINRVVRSQEKPIHLAVNEAMGNAIGLELLHRSARSGHLVHS
jgi:predicted dehydrogenase